MMKPEQDPLLSPIDVRTHLASTELFKALEAPVLDQVIQKIEWVRLPGGDTLFEQGEDSDSLYIVILGRLRVSVKRENGQEEVVGEVGRDEMVGEMGLLTGEARSATVRAIRDSVLVRLSNEWWYHIAERHTSIIFQMARTLAKRLAKMNRGSRIVTPLVNITLVATNSKVELSQFATHLATALGEVGTTLHLSSRWVESLWGTEGIGQTSNNTQHNIKFENWLNDQENKYQFIVYEADAEASNWTQRCIRQADRILLIGDATLPSHLGHLESELIHSNTNRTTACLELVLLHPQGKGEIRDTDQWLTRRQVSAHYHVRWNAPGDFARLARLLTGQAVGLAFGGGGVRGLAHLGVIRALQELEVPIDFIGGTSLGAIMAAQFALGWNYETMVRINEKMWRDSWPMNDYTVPFMACLSGQKLDQALKTMCGDIRIEDLALKFFCVSTNLTTASIAVHQEGLLWKRLRASCALPGIVPPEFDNESMLVDGAVLNNVPGDIMKRLCGGRVVAVDVSPREDIVFKPQYPERPLTRQILWGKMNPFTDTHTLPSLFDIVARSAMISNVSNVNRVKDQVELYLDIPLDQFGMSESKSFDQIIDAGYQFARRQIEAWKQKNPS